jgi:hypothetical protein
MVFAKGHNGIFDTGLAESGESLCYGLIYKLSHQ